jgi:hypothetical protein
MEQELQIQDAPRKLRSPERHSFASMIERCTKTNRRAYKYYGGRGITICDRWQGKGGFDNFIADMGPRPEGTTLDRIDNDGNYEPANCRWATKSVQERNKRRFQKRTPVDPSTIAPRLGGKPKKVYSEELVALARTRHAGGWSIGQNALAAGLPKSSLYRIVRDTPRLPPWVPDPNWVEDAQ